MDLSLISYQSNVISNKNVRFKAKSEAPQKAIKYLAPAVVATIVGGNAVGNNSKKLPTEEAAEKLEQAGFGGNCEIYYINFQDIWHIALRAASDFNLIVEDFIQMHNEVENGQPVTKEYVDSKLDEIMKKYNLPATVKSGFDGIYEEEVVDKLKYAFLEQWKYYADYCLSKGVKKTNISDYVLRRKIQPDEKILARFDDLLTRVGEPIKSRKFNDGGVYEYLNKYGDKITVSDDRHFRCEETLEISEQDGTEHTITKKYYLGGKDFLNIADQTNGVVCGSRGEGVSGVTERISTKNYSTEIRYDDWGIKEYEKYREVFDDKIVETTTIYFGDGSIRNEKTEIEYLK